MSKPFSANILLGDSPLASEPRTGEESDQLRVRGERKRKGSPIDHYSFVLDWRRHCDSFDSRNDVLYQLILSAKYQILFPQMLDFEVELVILRLRRPEVRWRLEVVLLLLYTSLSSVVCGLNHATSLTY